MTRKDLLMETNATPPDRYRVALLSDHAEVALWLSPRLSTVHVRWMAGQFSWSEANEFAKWATRTIRPKVEHHKWVAIPVSPDEPDDHIDRDRLQDHYAAAATEVGA